MTLELLNYAYIDPKYLSQAEVEIKDYFAAIEIPLKYESFKELVAVNPCHEKQITQQFKYITNTYAGCVEKIIDNIDRIIDKHKIEILSKDNQLNMLRKDNELLIKDLEIEKLKYTFLCYKHNIIE